MKYYLVCFGNLVIQQVMGPEKRGRMAQIMKSMICQDRSFAFIL